LKFSIEHNRRQKVINKADDLKETAKIKEQQKNLFTIRPLQWLQWLAQAGAVF